MRVTFQQNVYNTSFVGHASCLDLTDAMLKVIKTYPWQCMECKTCVECMNSTDEVYVQTEKTGSFIVCLKHRFY